jgi:hypothetical protein
VAFLSYGWEWGLSASFFIFFDIQELRFLYDKEYIEGTEATERLEKTMIALFLPPKHRRKGRVHCDWRQGCPCRLLTFDRIVRSVPPGSRQDPAFTQSLNWDIKGDICTV